MLRKIRIILAAVFFTGITLLFLDFTGTLHTWLGWMAKIQFLPAALALNFGVIAALIILTLLFGRVYCSVICPLGVMQDIISWIHGKTKKKNRFRFSYSPARNILRYGVLALFIAGLLLGAHSIAILIAPYSAYGRIAANLFAPIYQWANNLFAWMAERADREVMKHIRDFLQDRYEAIDAADKAQGEFTIESKKLTPEEILDMITPKEIEKEEQTHEENRE